MLPIHWENKEEFCYKDFYFDEKKLDAFAIGEKNDITGRKELMFWVSGESYVTNYSRNIAEDMLRIINNNVKEIKVQRRVSSLPVVLRQGHRGSRLR